MIDLSALIHKVVVSKAASNNEFALFYQEGYGWTAYFGNPCYAVGLGEVEGEFSGKGETPEEAVSDLLLKLAESP